MGSDNATCSDMNQGAWENCSHRLTVLLSRRRKEKKNTAGMLPSLYLNLGAKLDLEFHGNVVNAIVLVFFLFVKSTAPTAWLSLLEATGTLMTSYDQPIPWNGTFRSLREPRSICVI